MKADQIDEGLWIQSGLIGSIGRGSNNQKDMLLKFLKNFIVK